MDPNHFEYREVGSRPFFVHGIHDKRGIASGHATGRQSDNTVCHELGHLLGLSTDISPEIDNNWGANRIEYPSCMNYDLKKIRFCADEGIESAPNDWKVIEERMHTWRERYEATQ